MEATAASLVLLSFTQGPFSAPVTVDHQVADLCLARIIHWVFFPFALIYSLILGPKKSFFTQSITKCVSLDAFCGKQVHLL